jgi:argininosuccinate lyase
MKLWQKGIKFDRRIERFTVGNDPEIDLELVEFDCRASIAHARMLKEAGVLSAGEAKSLQTELRNIIFLKREKRFRIRLEHEDCHTAIENRLTRKLGKVGKKIHAGRSRNDQVLTAIRLYSREKLNQIKSSLGALIRILSRMSRRFGNAPVPGYTHSRKAMPYTVGKYFAAFSDAFKDDLRLLEFVSRLTDQNPLGSAAGYGTTLELDREMTTGLLGFRKTQTNELYAQNSRGKFESLTLAALSQVMLDIQRLASDLMLFSMEEFGFFRLPEKFCTGSSIMPQKKNPDVLEITRANFAVVHGAYLQVIETIKGLSSGYHRDLQLTKEPLIRGFRKTLETVQIMGLVLDNLKIDEDKCRQACTDDIYAADKVHKLVTKGAAFRDAYRRVSRKLEL